MSANDDRSEFEAARLAGLRRRHEQRLADRLNRKSVTDMDSLDYAALIHSAADLLYDADDPRAAPWPDPTTLGRLRSALRNIAAGLHSHCDDPADCSTGGTENQR